jgi:hypothetical protein
MLTDIVIDTNVFLHAQNPTEKGFKAAGIFLQLLLAADTELCVDGVFDTNAPHLSLIAHEYLTMIRPVGAGYAVLVQLLQSGRVKMNVSVKCAPHLRRMVVSLIPNDSRDRTFVFVACNSANHILVSHDWVDFKSHVREQIKHDLDVAIEEAADASERLSVHKSVESQTSDGVHTSDESNSG